jgi:hypothetical protein
MEARPTKGSLQMIGSNIARSFQVLVVIAAAFILANYFAHSGTRSSVEAADALGRQLGQCDTVAPAQAPALPHGGSVQGARREAANAYEACPTCPVGPGLRPGQDPRHGPRNPRGGPDD